MSEAQYRGFLEASPDTVIIVAQTGRIIFASNRIEAMFGHLPQELVGKPFSVLMPERYRDLHAGHQHRFMRDPKPRIMGAALELRALRKDGSEFLTEISLSPDRTPDGLVVIAAIRDVTFKGLKGDALKAENAGLRDLLTQAEIDVARLLAQVGIDATESEATKRLQRLLLEELHHRMKNTLATVIGITSQSLRTAKNLEQGRMAVESRLIALGRAHDLLLNANWTGAKLIDVIRAAIEPFDTNDVRRFRSKHPYRNRSRGSLTSHHVSQRTMHECGQVRRVVQRNGTDQHHINGRRKRTAVQTDMDRAGRPRGPEADAAQFWDTPHRPPGRSASR